MKSHMLVWIQRAVASLFFLGYIPGMPGTVGSAATVAGLWYISAHTHVSFTPMFWWLSAIALTAFSILASSRPRDVFGADDPKQVIIDECAGQYITFMMIPLSLNTLLLGFLLFRFFDIVKPFPVYRMEEVEGGAGITMDDVVAGIMANVSLMIIVWAYHVVKAWLGY
jgi:phosphatidylglycerophosphatase A